MPSFTRLAGLGLGGVYLAPDDSGAGSGGDGGAGAPGGATPPATPPAVPPAPVAGESAENATIRQMRAEIDATKAAAKEAQDKLAAIEQDRKKAEDEAAKKRGDFEKLANDRQAEIDRLKAEVATRDMDAQRARIGAKHKLPEAVAALLPDADEAAMEAKAAELAKAVGAPSAPETDAGKGNNPNPAPSVPGSPGAGKPDGERKQTYRFQTPGDVPW